jgi:hypothetical protein
VSSNKRGRTLAEVMSPIEDDVVSAQVEPTPSSEPSDTTAQSVVPVNVLVAPEDRRRLRQLSLDTSLSLQKLGHEAWNLLLQKRGLPPLKPVSANVPSGRTQQTRARAQNR